MNILYLANVRLPTEKAHGAQIMKTCEALAAAGAHNVTLGRPSGLSGRTRLEGLTRNYERLRRDGKLPATFEVIYGHAWKALPRTSPAGASTSVRRAR